MARIAFLGSKDMGLHVLRRLSDRTDALRHVIVPNDCRDPRSAAPAFAALAAERRHELLVAGTHRDTVRCLMQAAADVVIVCGWYDLLPVERFPESAFYAFHAAPLPRYRGHAPVVWQIIRGERSVGLSLFKLVPAMDAGPIVDQAELPVDGQETIGEVLPRITAAAVGMIDRWIDRLADGSVPLRDQDDSAATYCGLRRPEDGLIDWDKDASIVHNFIRAQSRPYPGAFTHRPDGTRVRVWRTRVAARPHIGVPGAVAARHTSTVTITCGAGAVEVLEADVDGEPSAPPAAIFSSLRMRLV